MTGADSDSIVGTGRTATIRVVIVDDHPVVRLGLAALIEAEDDMAVVGQGANGTEAIGLVAAHRPEVVLMDLRMPELDGVGATSAITKRFPHTKVLVVTTYANDTDIVRAVEAGAAGYVLKDAPQQELVQAIRGAAKGETVLAASVAARLVARMRAPVFEQLTARETDVLTAVARGGTNADVGRLLRIGEATVKTHLLHIFAKLGVDDRTAAVTVAIERGLISLPERR